MSVTRDPYYEWFGIPPKDQPPNHYRLLGLELFEENRDVIATAADRQMAFVKNYQCGDDAELSQRILNELAAARLCLLNAEKKRQYDAQLLAEMERAAPTDGEGAVPVTRGVVAGAAGDAPGAGNIPARSPFDWDSRYRRVVAVAAGAAALCILAGAVFGLLGLALLHRRGEQTETVASTRPETPSDAAGSSPSQPAPSPDGQAASDESAEQPATSQDGGKSGEQNNASATDGEAEQPQRRTGKAAARAASTDRSQWLNKSYETTIRHVAGNQWEIVENGTGKVRIGDESAQGAAPDR